MNIFQEVFAAARKEELDKEPENFNKSSNYSRYYVKSEKKPKETQNKTKLPEENKQKDSKIGKKSKVKKIIKEKHEENPKKEIAKKPFEEKSRPIEETEETTPILQENELYKIHTKTESEIEIEEAEKRIKEKKDHISQLEYNTMNALNELKEFKAILKAEKENAKLLEKENNDLSIRKQIVDDESRQYNDEIMEIMMENKEELQNKEEVWEYRYNELLCQQNSYDV